MAVRKITGSFRFDDALEALTDYSDDVNSAGFNYPREVLDDTAINDVHRSKTAGIRDSSVSASGYYVGGASGVIAALEAATKTSVFKTIEVEVENDFWSGEVLVEGFTSDPVTGTTVVTWNATFQFAADPVKSSIAIV